MSQTSIVSAIIATFGDLRLIHQTRPPSDELAALMKADENGASYQLQDQRSGDWASFEAFDCAGHLNYWLNVVAIDPPASICDAAGLLPDSPSLFDPSGLEVAPLAKPDAHSGPDRVVRPELAPAALAALAPLDPLARRSDDDWPGVLVRLGGDARLVVNGDGTRYAMQRRVPSDRGAVWVGKASYAKLSALLAKQADKFAGLADAVKHLPESPSEALPDLVQAKADLMRVYELTDWRRQDYGRVVRQDTQLRVVVDTDGLEYRLQWVKRDDYLSGDCNLWITLFKSPYAATVVNWIVGNMSTFDFEAREWVDCDEIEQRARLLLSDLPDNCADGDWPLLPERPASSARG